MLGKWGGEWKIKGCDLEVVDQKDGEKYPEGKHNVSWGKFKKPHIQKKKKRRHGGFRLKGAMTS